MTHYVITQARHAFGRPQEVKIHRIGEPKGRDQFGLDVGQVISVADVANLLATGDTVYVGVEDGPGAYRMRASILRGSNDELICVEDGGKPSYALMEIPQF